MMIVFQKNCQVTYTPSVVTYKNRWVENDFVCGGEYSVLQIVFDHNILFEKVKKKSLQAIAPPTYQRPFWNPIPFQVPL